jgi:hypothetical protein
MEVLLPCAEISRIDVIYNICYMYSGMPVVVSALELLKASSGLSTDDTQPYEGTQVANSMQMCAILIDDDDDDAKASVCELPSLEKSIMQDQDGCE